MVYVYVYMQVRYLEKEMYMLSMIKRLGDGVLIEEKVGKKQNWYFKSSLDREEV